jgi:hypothetical protein
MRRTSSRAADYVDLSPEEFAELLDLTEDEAPYLATATVRLPHAWVESWRTRVGVRELTVADLSIVLGVSNNTVFRYLREGSRPRLHHRLGTSTGSRLCRLVAPASLILYLRERSRLAGACPVIVETAGQRKRRGKLGQMRAAELCGDWELAERLRNELAQDDRRKRDAGA